MVGPQIGDAVLEVLAPQGGVAGLSAKLQVDGFQALVGRDHRERGALHAEWLAYRHRDREGLCLVLSYGEQRVGDGKLSGVAHGNSHVERTSSGVAHLESAGYRLLGGAKADAVVVIDGFTFHSKAHLRGIVVDVESVDDLQVGVATIEPKHSLSCLHTAHDQCLHGLGLHLFGKVADECPAFTLVRRGIQA